MSDSDDDIPLTVLAARKAASTPAKPIPAKPLSSKPPAARAKRVLDDDQSPVRPSKKAKPAAHTHTKEPEKQKEKAVPVKGKEAAAAPQKHKGKEAAAAPQKQKGKEEAAAPQKRKGKEAVIEDVDEDEEKEDGMEWWNADDNALSMKKGTIKWTSLHHNGVLFPPAYEAHGVKMLYDGRPVDLTAAQEEYATMYAACLNSDYPQKPVFNQNFWADFVKVLGPDHVIDTLDKCDFRPIAELLALQRAKKNLLSREEKQKAKKEKDEMEEPYAFATIDGRKERVGNFRVEPPGLFRGRGEHPNMGKVKPRIQPEDVTINCGENDQIPKPPAGHAWANVIHDNTVTWLAFWKDTINDSFKYVFLAADSTFKTLSDYEKYEKARRLKDCIDDIREGYTKELHDKDEEVRQRATALYLIDKLALRVGNEKGEDEADTVGCCSLRVEHVVLEGNNTVTFDFLGKDSIQYTNTVKVDEQVYRNLSRFKKGKKVGVDVFDRLVPAKLNSYLKELMDGLTAKVFRTFNASFLLDKLLHEREVCSSLTVSEKLVIYNAANRDVAILCNHQRSLPKGHQKVMEKMQTKVTADEISLEQLRSSARVWDQSGKEAASKLWDSYEEKHKKPMFEAQLAAERADFEIKMKEKEDQMAAVHLERLQAWTEADTKRKQKLESAEWKPKPMPSSLESLLSAVKRAEESLSNKKAQMAIKDDTKAVSLTTSKINYMDPRISIAWCKKNDVPVNKVFSNTMLKKFKWTLDTAADWRF
eukprot:ANDGO_06005.mRNA.1 DNA topoisomerase 1